MQKKYLTLLTALCGFLACLSHAGAQSTADPRRFAIVVGVSQYADPAILQLQKANKDAEDLASLLEGTGSYRAVKLMSSKLLFVDPLFPSRDNVIAQVEQLAGILKPSDQVLFFFSGHGLNDQASGDSYLLPIDAKTKNFVGTSLNLQKDVLSKFEAVGVNVVALIDACQKTITNDKGLAVVGVDRFKPGAKAVVIIATGPGKASYEDPKGNNGLFTKGLIAAFGGAADLDRDGAVSVDELETYLPDAVSEYAFDANLNQAPVVYDGAPESPRPNLGRVVKLPVKAVAPSASGAQPALATPASAIAPAPPASAIALAPAQGAGKAWEQIKIPDKMYLAPGVLVNGSIYYVGGILQDEKNKLLWGKGIRSFDLENKRLGAVKALDFEGAYISAIGLGNKIYFSGGAKILTTYNELSVFDPASNSLTALPKLDSGRVGHSMAALGDKIYAIGGIVGAITSGTTSRVDVYDIPTRTWSRAKDMLVNRVGAAAIGIEGKIYVFGGAVKDKALVDSIEIYDPTSNSWNMAAATLPMPMLNVGITQRGGLIYLFGGDTDSLSKTRGSTRIFTFDPKTGVLAELNDKLPISANYSLSCSEYNGKIYISGGSLAGDLKSVNPYVFVFDPDAAR